jgi:hypothetical protein
MMVVFSYKKLQLSASIWWFFFSTFLVGMIEYYDELKVENTGLGKENVP